MSASTHLAENILIMLDRGLKLDYVRVHLCSNALDTLRRQVTNTTNNDVIKTVVVETALNWHSAMRQVNHVRGNNDFNENAFAEMLMIRAPELFAAACLDKLMTAEYEAQK